MQEPTVNNNVPSQSAPIVLSPAGWRANHEASYQAASS
jgi:hypothetical protein